MRSGAVCDAQSDNSMKNTCRENVPKAFTSCQRRGRTKKSSFSQLNGPLIEKDVTSKCSAEKYELTDLKWTDKISECPTYHPSIEEFDDPLIYLQKISPEASKYGICKIVSPLKASVPAPEVLRDFKFSTYVQPLRLAEWNRNDKVIFSFGDRKHTYRTFKRMADKMFIHRLHDSEFLSLKQLEKKFWHEMASQKVETVQYAVNVDGSAFSTDLDDQLGTSRWNLKALPRLPNSVLRLVEHEIPGITYPMLYIGMLFSMFAWHVEDHYLYSINYHHIGAPKTWYGVPGQAAQQLEKVALDHVYSHDILSPDNEDGAFREIAQKTTMFPPSILLQLGVPVYKAVQMPGEFVITFPRAYHAGFSNGFNCGEAVNFAIKDWFPFGAMASRRYALLGMMPILPYEEVLCKEAVRLSKHSVLCDSSAGLASNHSVRMSFAQHMQFLNEAVWQLKDILENLKKSSIILSNSQGTTICCTCKRDCYLVFLACNHCDHLLCLFHEIKSVVCQCGGKLILFTREDTWKDRILQEVQQETKCGNNFCLQPDIISCTKSESIPNGKNHEHNNSIEQEAAAIKMRGKDSDDFDKEKPNKTACHQTKGLFSFFRNSKRARTSKHSAKNSKLKRPAFKVSSTDSCEENHN